MGSGLTVVVSGPEVRSSEEGLEGRRDLSGKVCEADLSK